MGNRGPLKIDFLLQLTMVNASTYVLFLIFFNVDMKLYYVDIQIFLLVFVGRPA